MIVDVPLNLGCTHSRMGEHPVCSPQPLMLPLMRRRRKIRSRSQAREVTAARHAQPTVFQEKKNGSLPFGGGGGGTLDCYFRVLTLGCGIHSLSFCLPHSTLDFCSSCLHFLSQLPPASLPDPPLLCPGPAEGHCG